MKVTRLPDGRFALQFSYSPRLIAACKSVPGMTWDPELRAWCGYADAITEIAVSLGGGWGVSLPQGEPIPIYEEHLNGLRGYQCEGVQFMVAAAEEGCLLADVMGAGKTAQAIRAAKALAQKTVVVCPSFVRGVWRDELKKWWPEAYVKGLEGLTPEPIWEIVESNAPWSVDGGEPAVPYNVVVIHYDILHAWAPELIKWGAQTIIFDECHYLSNEKAQRSKAAKELAHSCKYRIGLSGTPMPNRPRDLWNVVDTLSPGRFGSFFKFCQRYAGAFQKDVRIGQDVKTVWDFDGRSNLEELRRRLSYFMLRRTHDDIALELPPRTRQVIELKVPAKNRLTVTRELSAKETRRAMDLAADGKLKEVIAMIRQHVEDGYKVVAFCHRREVAEQVAEACGGLFIHGGITQAQRDDRIAMCRHAVDAGVLAATIDVASVGIDLSFASVAVFVELTWEPHELAQAEARLYRFGQTKPVLIQYTIALGTGEELIRDGVLAKLETIQEATGDAVSGLATDLRNEAGEADALRELWESLP